MEIKHYKQFTKHLSQRIKPKPKPKPKPNPNPNLYTRFKDRVKEFLMNPESPILKDHQLKGDKKDFRAFSITGDIRVVYYRGEDYIYFIDIGSHNQVY
ncbi:type II toxin-antitoxin system mRNA interferase toxin, RelE/StbE family [Candidatus Daviesbacteria bacterium]|nr:type II toxin-antitoxin system mRNA interferase toxin, RelE/StbE family [Candidatus Daviesbacteria bacterium]